MKRKLKRILIIDDDDDSNFFHRRLFRKMQIEAHVEICQDGIEALGFFKEVVKGNLNVPDLVLLDVNMPMMDGWEFLSEYQNQDAALLAHIVLIVYSSSDNPEYRLKLQEYGCVSDYYLKYLNRESMGRILTDYF